MKKIYLLILSVLLLTPNFVLNVMAQEIGLNAEYASLTARSSKLPYTLANDNKSTLDLIHDSAIPTSDDWSSRRIREAANVAYLSLAEASPQMRAVILTARYEIIVSKEWSANINSNSPYFYDLFPNDWTYPIIDTSNGSMLDPISDEFISPASLPGVYDALPFFAIETLNENDPVMRVEEYGNIFIAPYLTYNANTLLYSKTTPGVLYFLYITPNDASRFIPFRLEYFVNEYNGKGFVLNYTAQVTNFDAANENPPCWTLPGNSPVDLMVYARTTTSQNGVVSMLLHEI